MKNKLSGIEQLITELENYIPKQELTNPDVSASSIGWHIEHSLLTINLIVDTIKRSDPKEYKWTFNFWRIVVMTTKKIPRGRAKSPKIVRPTVAFNSDTLRDHVNKTRQQIRILETCVPNNFFVHPFFQKLNLASSIKFLEIHTNHHLKIIRDIAEQ
ncbi:MAG: hypothetical protein ACXWV5_11090 [Flavitalea sp.]